MHILLYLVVTRHPRGMHPPARSGAVATTRAATSGSAAACTPANLVATLVQAPSLSYPGQHPGLRGARQ